MDLGAGVRHDREGFTVKLDTPHAGAELQVGEEGFAVGVDTPIGSARLTAGYDSDGDGKPETGVMVGRGDAQLGHQRQSRQSGSPGPGEPGPAPSPAPDEPTSP